MDAIEFRMDFDIGIFFTGDSDFLPLVTKLKNEGKKIYIFSTEETVSLELRAGSDGYYSLADFPQIHGDDLRTRP